MPPPRTLRMRSISAFEEPAAAGPAHCDHWGGSSTALPRRPAAAVYERSASQVPAQRLFCFNP
jgi:hypothetical protein